MCTPKPLCQCDVCVEAREKGYPYARCGCSLYLEDISLLVDTPEDIAVALNNANIRSVDHIMYSHWDPDHTLGMRIMEQLRLEWLDHWEGIRCTDPVQIYAQPDVMEDLNAIQNKFGSFLDYYEKMNLVRRHLVAGSMTIGPVTITVVSVPKQAVSVFVFESGGRKLVYAPCDCLPFPQEKVLYNPDILLMGNTIVGRILKDGRRLTENHPILEQLYSFEAALALQKQYSAKELIFTHLEEDWGKSFDDYKLFEQNYPGVRFAYDGMKIEL